MARQQVRARGDTAGGPCNTTGGGPRYGALHAACVRPGRSTRAVKVRGVHTVHPTQFSPSALFTVTVWITVNGHY